SELKTGFPVDRIEILRLVVPSGQGDTLRVVVPSRRRPAEEDVWMWEPDPDDLARIAGGAIILLCFRGGFELEEASSASPIAAEALLEPSSGENSLSFPLTWGEGLFTVPHGHASSYSTWSGPSAAVTLYWGNQNGLHGGEYLKWPPDACADGEQPAQLVLIPSRSLALGTRAFDRYIGEEVSLPITLEIRTARAEWLNSPGDKEADTQ
ncbi:MAG: hypothetical protein KAW67_09685, partial [Candidatus Eisenbacteria sp.]|nr:hypothetical protein [Candidatus Eisenbacteria bacterium]